MPQLRFPPRATLADILGRVVEVAFGMPLDRFFQTRIFEPLCMRDSYFYLPPEKASRLAAVYAAQEDGSIQLAPEKGRTGQGEYVNGPRKCFSGGAGLVSTAPDYGCFLQMLLNGGELDGARVLSPAAIAAMTANQVGDLYQNGNFGFGLGFEVIEHVGRAGRLGAQGGVQLEQRLLPALLGRSGEWRGCALHDPADAEHGPGPASEVSQRGLSRLRFPATKIRSCDLLGLQVIAIKNRENSRFPGASHQSSRMATARTGAPVVFIHFTGKTLMRKSCESSWSRFERFSRW